MMVVLQRPLPTTLDSKLCINTMNTALYAFRKVLVSLLYRAELLDQKLDLVFSPLDL